MKKIIFISIIALLLNLFLLQSVSAIGQMTKPIVIKDVLRGQEVVETLKLFNSEDKEVVYYLAGEGDVAGWATFFSSQDTNLENPITEINMPAKSTVSAFVKFKVPEDAANATYLGQISVATGPSDSNAPEGEVSVNVLEKVGRRVSISVTDKEIIELEASVIPLKYGINSGQPLKIKINYYNNGNVAMEPDVQLTIKKDGNTIFNAIFTYPESEEAIKPKTRKTMSYVEWSSSGAENGSYRAEVKILHNNEVVAEDDFRFSIGYFQSGIWVSAISFLGGGSLGLGWVVLGMIFLIIVALFNILEKRGLNLGKIGLIFSSWKKLF